MDDNAYGSFAKAGESNVYVYTKSNFQESQAITQVQQLP